MNITPLLGGLLNGALMGYAMNGNPFTNKTPGAASPQMGGGADSSMLPGIMPGASVPMQTGSGAGGGMFGGVGQGLTNAGAGLFQPGGGAMIGGNAPSRQQQMMSAMGGGMNPLALALMMNRS